MNAQSGLHRVTATFSGTGYVAADPSRARRAQPCLSECRGRGSLLGAQGDTPLEKAFFVSLRAGGWVNEAAKQLDSKFTRPRNAGVTP